MPFDILSNTPLQTPPSDYFCGDSGRWFSLSDGKDAGKKMFYYDQQLGDGDPEATVVFVHGNPESSYTYRHVRDTLIASGRPLRLVAMDHIGYGLSDQATFEMIDMHHSANLLQLIRHMDLRDVTLAIHDWGGPIGVGAFIEDAWRVSNLTVMNTTLFPMPSDGLTYENFPISWLPWCELPKTVPNRVWGGVASYIVSHGTPQGPIKLLLNVAKYSLLHLFKMIAPGTPEYVWSQSMRSLSNTKSSKRMVAQTPVWGYGYRYDDPTHGPQDNHSYYAKMQELLPIEWGPNGKNIGVSGFFGRWDACGKQSVVDQWLTALPQMKNHTYCFEGVGHFVEEYKGREIALSILELNGLTAA